MPIRTRTRNRYPMTRPLEGVTLLGSVVAGVDGSEHAERAVRWAVEQASLEHRQLVVVSVGDGTGGLAYAPWRQRD
jgi:nucleotide-binding universal stress UspA family protein